MEIVHLREGSPEVLTAIGLFPVTVTHGLKLGRSWSRQTNIERITIPSSTNSFHHPHAVQPRQTCTYKSREKTGMHDGNPMWFHTSHQEGGFVQDLAKPRKISQYLSPSRRKHARYRTKTNGALTKSNGSRTSNESITMG